MRMLATGERVERNVTGVGEEEASELTFPCRLSLSKRET
jgi:hypothetical protein